MTTIMEYLASAPYRRTPPQDFEMAFVKAEIALAEVLDLHARREVSSWVWLGEKPPTFEQFNALPIQKAIDPNWELQGARVIECRACGGGSGFPCATRKAIAEALGVDA